MSVTLHTTKGDIKLEVHCDEVKRSAANFLALCASHKYDNCAFHRIEPAFIIQTGDPTGRGTKSRAAFARRLPDEPHPALTFARAGVVAFANAGAPSPTGVGSQFFITLAPSPHLDQSCTVFARVIHGMSVVQAIAAAELKDSRPVDRIAIDTVTVHANPFATADIQFQIE